MAKSDPLATPMMRQYLETRRANPGALLFMRMGDFYECFLEDAEEAARILGITLTSRNKGQERAIPMAGVPHHSLRQHLPKLLAAGKRVAIMDQLEDPAEAKGLVKRGLTRVVTAGTRLDEDELADDDACFLVALTGLAGTVGLAALDCAGGSLQVEEAHGAAGVALALARIQPAELLLPTELAEDPATPTRLSEATGEAQAPPLAGLPDYAWHEDDARRYLHERLGVASLDGFGIGDHDGRLAVAAAAVMRYATQNAGRDLSHVRGITRVHPGEYLVLDGRCRRNLELVRNQIDHTRAHTLLATVDRTRTAPGGRLLASWILRPLARPGPIRARQAGVAQLVADEELRADLREELKGAYDLERLLGRLGTGRCNARDLVQLAGTLRRTAAAGRLLHGTEVPPVLAAAADDLAPAVEWRDEVLATLVDDPPPVTGEGGMVRDGVDPELDELRGIKRNAGEWLAAYQAREAERVGLPKLKVGYNKVFGYYVEVGKSLADRLPDHFVRKQTLTSAERYITPELKDYEDKVLSAEDRIRTREAAIFAALRETGTEHLGPLRACAEALALVDVLAALAETARLRDWVLPEIDESRDLELDAARHPVVEEVLGRGAFVPNDVRLHAGDEDGTRLALITGPNMAGKSTFIRQVALAVILAQIGGPVPAGRARIGLVDRLFTRIGAGDELARNLSTFMVEMSETAAILHNATERSLVILDEVGRGTSTFDGLSLAWAMTEYLHDRSGCRCLFATHYHELTDLGDDRPGIANLTVAVAEEDDDVVFLHRIVPGAATKSYGIHVARLAGVPAPVIRRAGEVLGTIEELNVTMSERERREAREQGSVQLTLFDSVEHPAVGKLKRLRPDELSPRQALDTLYELKEDL